MRKAEPWVVALAAFVLLALLVAPLATPYWWDAGAVYAPGAKWLLEHGFDARPGVFPDDLSRGHTPLYYLILAVAYRVGGAGPVAGHALTFAFAWLAVVTTYALGRELHGRAAGALAAGLLLVSPLFLTMSSEALPEVPLTALTAATFYAFARGKLGACAVVGTLVVLVKETGLACPVAIAAVMAIEAVRSGSLRAEVRRIALVLVPAAVLVGFFLYQKAATGWFVTPYHLGLFNEEHALGAQALRVARSIWVDDGRIVAVTAALILVALRGRAGLGSWDRRAQVLLAFGIHAAFNVAFFTKSFYLERYTLPVHVGTAVALAGVLAAAGPLRARAPALAAAALTAAIALSRRDAGEDMVSGETSFRYLHAVRAYGALYRRLEAEGGAPVVLTEWPVTDALREPFLGWVSRPVRCIGLSDRTPGEPFDHVIAVTGEGSYGRLVKEAEERGLHQVARSQEGPASIELWGP